jgi:hypothetical protein
VPNTPPDPSPDQRGLGRPDRAAVVGGQDSTRSGRIEFTDRALRVADQRPVDRPGLGVLQRCDYRDLALLGEDLLSLIDPPVERRFRLLVAPSEVSHDIGQRVEGIDNSFIAARAMMTDTNDTVLKRKQAPSRG